MIETQERPTQQPHWKMMPELRPLETEYFSPSEKLFQTVGLAKPDAGTSGTPPDPEHLVFHTVEPSVEISSSYLMDITPQTVSKETYERTREQLLGIGYKIFTIQNPRSILEHQYEGRIYNHVIGEEFADLTPPPMEIALEPTRLYLDGENKKLEEQFEMLKEYETWFYDEEYPEYIVQGVRAVLLPAAIITELDQQNIEETGKPLIQPKKSVREDEEGDEIIEYVEQFVTCSDDIGNSWVIMYGRLGGKRPDLLNAKPLVTTISTRNITGTIKSDILRAVLLPVPAQ